MQTDNYTHIEHLITLFFCQITRSTKHQCHIVINPWNESNLNEIDTRETQQVF